MSSCLTFSPLPRLSPCTPCGAGLSSGRYAFCGTFLVSKPCVQDFGTVRVTDHPALRSSDFPLLPIARLYGVSEGATICSPSTPSFHISNLPPYRPIRQTICCLSYIPHGCRTHPKRPIGRCMPGPFRAGRAVTPLSGSVDFILHFDLPPNRGYDYSGDTERGHCSFEPR